MIRIAFDSNILVYQAGVDRAASESAKIAEVRRLVDRLSSRSDVTLIAPTQTLGELYIVLRRAGTGAETARTTVAKFAAAYETPGVRVETVLAALDLAAEHNFQFWDALIVSAAAEAGCALLLSEDMQHGVTVRGVTVVNPFATPTHAALRALLPA